MPTSRRLPALLALCLSALLVIAVAPASAGPPRKGATYAGTISQPGPGNFKLPLRFDVSRTGESAANFKMADGPPTATTCGSGPWGHPVSRRTSISDAGRLSITMRLADGADNPDVGRIKIEGRFGPEGRFSGTAYTRTDSRSCNGDFPFTIRAR